MNIPRGGLACLSNIVHYSLVYFRSKEYDGYDPELYVEYSPYITVDLILVDKNDVLGTGDYFQATYTYGGTQYTAQLVNGTNTLTIDRGTWVYVYQNSYLSNSTHRWAMNSTFNQTFTEDSTVLLYYWHQLNVTIQTQTIIGTALNSSNYIQATFYNFSQQELSSAIYDGNSIDGCTCAEGATWDGVHCVWPEVTECPEGQVVHPDSGNCIWSSTTWCSIAYGESVYDGNSIDGCACAEGATWNGSQCVLDSCFSDTVDHYYATAICYVKDNGIVQGYEDGTFRPDNYINRAEFMKIIMSASYDTSVLYGSYCFDDIGAEWYAAYICSAFDMGIIDGYPDGTFHPEYLINLAEALKIIFEAAGVTTTNTGGAWYDPYINTANSIGLLNTINSDPGHLLTRGEMAELIYVSETQI